MSELLYDDARYAADAASAAPYDLVRVRPRGWVQIWASLLFLDLPKQLAHARDPDFGTFGSRLGNSLFFLVFGLFSWLSTVVQLLFPLVFAALLVVAPLCY
jgi:hypothetical protein